MRSARWQRIRAQVIARDELFASWVIDLLEEASDHDFDLDDQASRWSAWKAVNDANPSKNAISAEAYAQEMIIPRDRKTGDRFVRAGWLQSFTRINGARESPEATTYLLAQIGLERQGPEGQIKATSPFDPGVLNPRFYIVPRAWLEGLEATE